MNKKMTEIIWLALILVIMQMSTFEAKERSQRPQKTMLSGGLVSTGEISSNSVTIELENNLYALRAIFKRLSASNIVSKLIQTNVLSTPLLIPNNEKNIINISAYLQVKGEIKFDDEKVCTTVPKKKSASRGFPSGTSFLQLKSLTLNGVKQFQMIKEENNEDVSNSLNEKFLSLLAKNYASKLKKESEEVLLEKTIEIPYDFSHVLIESSFSFINALWNGNTAFIKINGHVYWMDQHNWVEEDQVGHKGTLCEDPEALRERWTSPIRIVYKQSQNKRDNKLHITFGFKYNHSNNISNTDFHKCQISQKKEAIGHVLQFSEMYISLK